MTGTFTEEQLRDAARVLLDRVANCCDCVQCRQERMFAEMLVYAATLRHVYTLEELCALGYHDIINDVCTHCRQVIPYSDKERAAILAAIDGTIKTIDRAERRRR